MDKSTHDVRRTNWLNIIEQCQQRPEKYDREAMACR